MTIARCALLASAAFALAGCRGRPKVAPDPNAIPLPVTTQTLRADQAFVLENDGGDAPDTSVAVLPGMARTIVLRQPAPDNTVFATLEIPAGGFGRSGDSVHLTLAPRPGVYGLDIGADASFGPGIILTFKYAVHFAAPAAAVAKYGSGDALEKRLVIARRNPDGSLALLASGRPARDNLSALLNTPGTYLAVAPR